jgi:hypothetical protein
VLGLCGFGRGVHPWELAPSASSHVEKEIAPPQERLRKMHEYGNQVRKKRGILAQAVHSRHAQAGARARRSTRPRSSSPSARRPRPGSFGDAGAGGAGGDRKRRALQSDEPFCLLLRRPRTWLCLVCGVCWCAAVLVRL